MKGVILAYFVFYVTTLNEVQGITCSSGFIAHMSGTFCVPCPAGTYNNMAGVTVCSFCLAGKFSDEAAITCNACLAGTYSETAGASSCTVCLAGTYSETAGASSCTVCLAGTYSVTVGASLASTCTACTAGKYSETVGSSLESTCTACPAGMFSFAPAGASACLTCPSSQFRDLSMAWAPMALDYGGHSNCKYVDGWSWNQPVYVCSDAWAIWWYWYVWLYYVESAVGGNTGYVDRYDIGAYFNGEPEPVTALIASSTNIQWCLDCSVCSRGTFMSGSCTSSQDTICSPCSAGKFSSQEGSTICQNCPVGSFSVSGSSVCTACPAGMFSFDPAGASACLTCPSSQFRDLSMAWAPMALDYGGHSNCKYVDGWSWNQPVYVCSDAWAIWWYWYVWIYYVESAVGGGYGYIDRWDIGAYLYGEQEPVTALIASSTNIQWCLDCSVCSSGTFISDSCTSSKDTVCTPCSAGKFSSQEGSTACQNCPVGSFSVSGSSVCTACPAGKYNTGTGITSSSQCVDCMAGTYSTAVAATTQTACLNCSSGSYSGSGASGCMQCASGYTSSEASAVCTEFPPCSEGYYGQNPKCSQCPPNTNSSFNHTFTILDCRCLPGFVCTYTKQISVVLTFRNMSWEMLNLTTLSRSSVMDAIAAAAGVSIENVHIHVCLSCGMAGEFTE